MEIFNFLLPFSILALLSQIYQYLYKVALYNNSISRSFSLQHHHRRQSFMLEINGVGYRTPFSIQCGLKQSPLLIPYLKVILNRL